MRIGVDIHGVIDLNPNLSRVILKALIDAGHEIFIISGPPLTEIFDILKNVNLKSVTHYHGIRSIVDFLQQRNVKMWLDKKNTWWADYKDWWGAKSKICDELNIDIMVDDSVEYAYYFDDINTKFILFTGDIENILQYGSL